MLQLTFVFLGLVAVLASGATMRPTLDTPTRTMTGAFAIFAWAYWAVSALSVSTTTQLVTTEPTQYLGLTALGLAAAGVMLLATARLAFGTATRDYTNNSLTDD